jgi:M3 family oligoendopeptidase
MKLEDVKYSRPDIVGFEAAVKAALASMQGLSDYQEFKKQFLAVNKLSKDFMGAYTIVSVRYSQNTADKFYEDEQNFFDEILPQFQKSSTDFTNMILDSVHKNQLSAEFGSQFLDLAELARKTISEEVMPLLQKENVLVSEYQKLTSQIKIEFEGKTYNTSGMAPLLENTDRDYRKRASKAYYGEMLKNQPEIDRIYDELVKVRTEISSKLGYTTFTQLGYDRMGRTCYGPVEITEYREFVLKYVTPRAHELKKKIAKTLGIDKPYQYDGLLFPDGNPTPKTSPEQMIADAQIMYNELSKETGEFFNMMQEKGMLDLLNRENKSPGGYCTYVDAVKSPFIFSNFNGTSHDVDVLTHEAGHAFQCYCSMHFELGEYYFPTSESAEIHSMSMEFFAWKWVDKFFLQDTEKYKLGHLMKSFLFLPYGVSIDEFQYRVYENPNLTPQERRAIWLEIQGKYMPWVEYDNEPFLENGGRWQNQGHLFFSPFYYIDYTLAQLCAFQFYKKMNGNFENAWQDYYELCCAGGSKNFLELLPIAKVSSPFEESGFKATVEFVYGEIENIFTTYNQKAQA